MGQPPNEQDLSWLTKFGIFILSALLGVAAKIVVLNNDKKITTGILVRNIILSAFASWMVWNLCQLNHVSDNQKYIYGALAARFSDAVIMLIWNFFKSMITKDS